MDMPEEDVLEDAARRVLVVEVAEAPRLDVEILEGDAPDVGAALTASPGADGVDGGARPAHTDVPERGVAHFAVADAEADGVAVGREDAVRHDDVRAVARTL